MMLLSETLKQPVVIKLTGPWEEHIDEANNRKIPRTGMGTTRGRDGKCSANLEK